MAWSERSDEGAERTQRQNRRPDEPGGMGGIAPHLDNRGQRPPFKIAQARRGLWGRVNEETDGSVATKGNGVNAAPNPRPRRSRGVWGAPPPI